MGKCEFAYTRCATIFITRRLNSLARPIVVVWAVDFSLIRQSVTFMVTLRRATTLLIVGCFVFLSADEVLTWNRSHLLLEFELNVQWKWTRMRYCITTDINLIICTNVYLTLQHSFLPRPPHFVVLHLMIKIVFPHHQWKRRWWGTQRSLLLVMVVEEVLGRLVRWRVGWRWRLIEGRRRMLIAWGVGGASWRGTRWNRHEQRYLSGCWWLWHDKGDIAIWKLRWNKLESSVGCVAVAAIVAVLWRCEMREWVLLGWAGWRRKKWMMLLLLMVVMMMCLVTLIASDAAVEMLKKSSFHLRFESGKARNLVGALGKAWLELGRHRCVSCLWQGRLLTLQIDLVILKILHCHLQNVSLSM